MNRYPKSKVMAAMVSLCVFALCSPMTPNTRANTPDSGKGAPTLMHSAKKGHPAKPTRSKKSTSHAKRTPPHKSAQAKM
jgi:hypothetical protein